MADKKTCFVIMPFDEPYYARFDSTYKPGIEAAGLRAYRVDKDRTARKLVDFIHKKIEAAHVCFAEISTDRPNVWYELGYARACGKQIVLVCEESRNIFPFDLEKMRILRHSSKSGKDFDELKREITEEIRTVAELADKAAASVAAVASSQNGDKIDTDKLDFDELRLMKVMLENQHEIAAIRLLQGAEKEGMSRSAAQLALDSLCGNRLIAKKKVREEWDEYFLCTTTPAGKSWCKKNRIRILSIPKSDSFSDMDDVPF